MTSMVTTKLIRVVLSDDYNTVKQYANSAIGLADGFVLIEFQSNGEKLTHIYSSNAIHVVETK